MSLRRRINEIDEQILHLLNERVDVSKGIGMIKRKQGIAIRDYQREDELYRHIMRKSSELGLETLKVRGIYKEIIAMCTHAQESNTDSQPYRV